MQLTHITLADKLEPHMLALPQVECAVNHIFGPGIYIREVTIPAGTLLVGHHHKDSHSNLLLSGEIYLIEQQQTLKAPMFLVTPPGRKSAYAITDVVWQNIYPTTETDIETLENMLFEKSDNFKGAV